MNRETKRRLQRQGLDPDTQSAKPSPRRAPAPNAKAEPRTKPKVFVQEVNAELRKVAWPTRAETVNLSLIVFVFLVVATALIAGLDYGFSKSILWIIGQ